MYIPGMKGARLYPFDKMRITRSDYIRFGMRMKPYLSSRWSGIDRLDIFIEGFEKYIRDCQAGGPKLEPLGGHLRRFLLAGSGGSVAYGIREKRRVDPVQLEKETEDSVSFFNSNIYLICI